MRTSGDPRADKGGDYDAFDNYHYFGDSKPMPASKPPPVRGNPKSE
jgi:hypothetical protein